LEIVKSLNLIFIGVLAAAAVEITWVQPSELVSRLSAKPAIFQVGPNMLFRSKHIPSAVYAGPASKPEGLEMLKAAVADLPHDREIVLYCGCCPLERCPNIRPAFELLRQMGFTRVKVLHLPENFKTDWIDKGYPIATGE
jgi:rhodanese-related sulfurtransferase